MAARYYLGTTDYAVLVVTLLTSAAIGIVFRFSGGRQKTTREYFLANRNMSQILVTLSITVTITSAVTMLGTPSETYRYGLQHVVIPFGIVIGMLLSSYLFIPVYFQCGVSTVYEFLELRYGKCTRLTVSALFVIQTILYMSAVLYGPALALSAVTDLTLTTSILVIGGVCTFYSALGGLKAVIWTDALQAVLMFTCMIAFYAASIGDAGGISTIYERASEGKRLQLFNFKVDLTARYTFWNCFLQGLTLGLGNYGTSQLEVQRMLSINQSSRASRTLRMSTLPVFLLHLMCYLAGLVLYSIYYLCDPVLNKNQTGLTKYDQMLPFYMVSTFSTYPGLTGLCVAGIFSGSLSTISSALNSLSTVTVIDFIQPFLKLNEKRNVQLAKIFSFFYGITCISLTFSFVNVQSLKQLSVSLIGTLVGPIIAIFLFGVLSRRVSEKCVMIGALSSLPFTCFIGFGSLISGYVESPLELKSNNCSSIRSIANDLINMTDCCEVKNNFTSETTSLFPANNFNDTFVLFKISYPWFAVIGCLCASFMIFVTSCLVDSKENIIEADSQCLSPVTRLWIKSPVNPDKCLVSANGHVLEENVFAFQDTECS